MSRIIERSKEVLETDFPSGKVIFHTASRRPYILNKTASVLWDYCKAPRDLDGVIKYLIKEYGISRIAAERDVKAFAEGMRKRKVMKVYGREDKV